MLKCLLVLRQEDAKNDSDNFAPFASQLKYLRILLSSATFAFKSFLKISQVEYQRFCTSCTTIAG